jgi:Tol biopolymer transport system component
MRFEVSPDGRAIVFSAFLRDRSGTIMQVMTPAGPVELARRKQPEMLVVQGWSPDSKYVVFTIARTNAPPPHDLWRVPAWGGTPEHLGTINGATQINPMAISPLGSALAYTTGTPLQELWIMEHFLPQ